MTHHNTTPTVCFGDVAREVTESTHSPLEDGFECYIGLEHLDPESLKIRRWGLIEETATTFTRVFRAGQVLFGRRRAYQRKAALAEFDGICSGDIIVMEAKPDKLLPELLPFIVQTEGFYEHALSTSAGSLSPRTKWSALAKYEFPLPPLEEQRRIAEILWAVEDAIESYNIVVRDIQRFKLSYWNSQVQEANWDAKCIGEVGSVSNGTTPSRKELSYWTGGTIPWLPTGKVHDQIITHADEFVTEKALNECSIRLLPVGTVLVAMIGQGKTRGSAAYLAMEACINQNFAAIQPSSKVDSWYLFHTLTNSYHSLRQFSHGTNQGALNCKLIERFPIPLPPIDEQIKIATVMRDFDSQISNVTSHLTIIAEMKKSLLEYLVSKEASHV